MDRVGYWLESFHIIVYMVCTVFMIFIVLMAFSALLRYDQNDQDERYEMRCKTSENGKSSESCETLDTT